MSPNRESAIAESWQRTLAGIPTILGRLSYLASLRSSNIGTYEHFGLSQKLGASEVDRLLRQNHLQLFQEWLCFGLERQKQELEEYFSDIEGDKREVVASWLLSNHTPRGCRRTRGMWSESFSVPIWRSFWN